ncbi:Cytochrome P450 71A21 [Morella rubra]|uniref:Cytochrome P450 71A21 n=1 Tax=Morella rubra TaxID=262757 RepID=A0A6A1VWW6_9ROSI|nr:Cytochrome P450 71A21 [Morella rubra]
MALMPMLQQSWQELQIFLLSLLLFCSLYVFKRIPNGKQNLPPSPPKLPIIGHLHHLGTLPHRSLHALSKKYGPIMFLYFGHSPTLVVSSTDMAKEVVKTHDLVFSNRPPITAAKILFCGSRDVVFSTYGEYWRQAGKNCVLELLSLKRVQSFQYVREAEVEELVNKIHDSCLKKASVNLSEMLIETSNKIITRCILGQKYEEDGDNEFGQVSRRLLASFSSLCLGDFFPHLGWIDAFTGVIPSLKAISKEADSFLDQVVQRPLQESWASTTKFLGAAPFLSAKHSQQRRERNSRRR